MILYALDRIYYEIEDIKLIKNIKNINIKNYNIIETLFPKLRVPVAPAELDQDPICP